ncbi:MAG: hypothetical protein AAF802_19565 [Planctomycetota bacterium]
MSDPESPDPADWVTKEDVDLVWMLAFNDLIGDRQLDLVSGHYGFRPIESPAEAIIGAVYLYRRQDKCTMVILQQGQSEGDLVLADLQNDKNRVETTIERLIALSTKRRLVLLLKRKPANN